jgi:hypothetical protein
MKLRREEVLAIYCAQISTFRWECPTFGHLKGVGEVRAAHTKWWREVDEIMLENYQHLLELAGISSDET